MKKKYFIFYLLILQSCISKEIYYEEIKSKNTNSNDSYKLYCIKSGQREQKLLMSFDKKWNKVCTSYRIISKKYYPKFTQIDSLHFYQMKYLNVDSIDNVFYKNSIKYLGKKRFLDVKVDLSYDSCGIKVDTVLNFHLKKHIGFYWVSTFGH